jgi:hypothetical protein
MRWEILLAEKSSILYGTIYYVFLVYLAMLIRRRKALKSVAATSLSFPPKRETRTHTYPYKHTHIYPRSASLTRRVVLVDRKVRKKGLIRLTSIKTFKRPSQHIFKLITTIDSLFIGTIPNAKRIISHKCEHLF